MVYVDLTILILTMPAGCTGVENCVWSSSTPTFTQILGNFCNLEWRLMMMILARSWCDFELIEKVWVEFLCLKELNLYIHELITNIFRNFANKKSDITFLCNLLHCIYVKIKLYINYLITFPVFILKKSTFVELPT